MHYNALWTFQRWIFMLVVIEKTMSYWRFSSVRKLCGLSPMFLWYNNNQKKKTKHVPHVQNKVTFRGMLPIDLVDTGNTQTDILPPL